MPYGPEACTPEIELDNPFCDNTMTPTSPNVLKALCLSIRMNRTFQRPGISAAAPEGFQRVGDGAVQDGDGWHAHVIERLSHRQTGLVRPPLCDHHTELDSLQGAHTLKGSKQGWTLNPEHTSGAHSGCEASRP